MITLIFFVLQDWKQNQKIHQYLTEFHLSALAFNNMNTDM